MSYAEESPEPRKEKDDDVCANCGAIRFQHPWAHCKGFELTDPAFLVCVCGHTKLAHDVNIPGVLLGCKLFQHAGAIAPAQRDRISELFDELAEAKTDVADLRQKLHFTENARDDARLANDVQHASIKELRDNLRLAEETIILGLERIEDLQQRLRVAESVRDDARAASQRYLDEKRVATTANTHYAALLSSQEKRIVELRGLLQGNHDDASAMVTEHVHTECRNMPGGTGPCACLDGCGACDSCGRWLCLDGDHTFVGDSCRECGKPIELPTKTSPS